MQQAATIVQIGRIEQVANRPALLTEEEDVIDTGRLSCGFDIPLLGRRVTAITAWIGREPGHKNLSLGYFGASTGAAAALVAAAEHPNHVRAVVSRGWPARLGWSVLEGRDYADALHRGKRRFGGTGHELIRNGSTAPPDGTQTRNHRGRVSLRSRGR